MILSIVFYQLGDFTASETVKKCGKIRIHDITCIKEISSDNSILVLILQKYTVFIIQRECSIRLNDVAIENEIVSSFFILMAEINILNAPTFHEETTLFTGI